mmetsp:Transcript_32613/g.97323  ORF Transcript_32613/g.97323 Transcript_32613/m.97323 type:complete len:274 (-) Transcript_32613:295-1116(-)
MDGCCGSPTARAAACRVPFSQTRCWTFLPAAACWSCLRTTLSGRVGSNPCLGPPTDHSWHWQRRHRPRRRHRSRWPHSCHCCTRCLLQQHSHRTHGTARPHHRSGSMATPRPRSQCHSRHRPPQMLRRMVPGMLRHGSRLRSQQQRLGRRRTRRCSRPRRHCSCLHQHHHTRPRLRRSYCSHPCLHHSRWQRSRRPHQPRWRHSRMNWAPACQTWVTGTQATASQAAMTGLPLPNTMARRSRSQPPRAQLPRRRVVHTWRRCWGRRSLQSRRT